MSKNIIAFVTIICAILGLSYVMVDNDLIIFNDIGENVTIPIDSLENATYDEIIDVITNKNESVQSRLKEFELKNLIDCRKGEFKNNNLVVKIESIKAYDLCVVQFVVNEREIKEYIYRIENNRELREYIRNYDKLDRIKERVEKVKEVQLVQKEISVSGFKEYDVKEVKKMPGPYTYLVEVEETVEKYNRYDDNSFIITYIEENKKLSILEILDILQEDVCEMYNNWSIYSMELNPDDEYVYNKLREMCVYEV